MAAKSLYPWTYWQVTLNIILVHFRAAKAGRAVVHPARCFASTCIIKKTKNLRIFPTKALEYRANVSEQRISHQKEYSDILRNFTFHAKRLADQGGILLQLPHQQRTGRKHEKMLGETFSLLCFWLLFGDVFNLFYHQRTCVNHAGLLRTRTGLLIVT